MASLAARGCLVSLAAACLLATLVIAEPEFLYITGDRAGSVQGGVELTLKGSGFSQDLVITTTTNEETTGIKVYLVNEYQRIPCDVVLYHSNDEKVVCITRAGDEGVYDTVVEVDGMQIPGCLSTSASKCQFTYWKASWGAYVSEVYQNSGPIGTNTTLFGRFFTILYEDLQQLLEEESNSYSLKSITWGPSRCTPIDPTTGEVYRLEYRDEDSTQWVYISCSPETNVPGSYPVVVQISGRYGIAYPYSKTFLVDWKDELYHFQQYAKIESVYPQLGSLEGGTELKISGDGFVSVSDVMVGDVPCEVLTSEPSEITCRTGPALNISQSVHRGNRGLKYEVLKADSFTRELEPQQWNTSDPKYYDLGVLQEPKVSEPSTDSESFYSRLTGYFVPPRDGNYTFYVRGDDFVALWLSNSSDPANMAKVAYVNTYTSSFDQYSSQTSERLSLQKDQPYYLECYHFNWASGSLVEMGVAFHNTQWSHEAVDSALNDVQLISTEAESSPEVQTITVTGTREVQAILVDISACVLDSDSKCTLVGNFTVRLGESETVIDTQDLTVDLEDAINALASLGTNQVSVTIETDTNFINLILTFASEESITDLVDVTYTGPQNISISVEEVSDGAEPVAPSEFIIEYAGIQSAALTYPSSPQEVEDALVEMFSIGCVPAIDEKQYFFYQDYESDDESPSGEYGTRVRDIEAYCGRTSLMTPTYIFREEKTPSSDGEKTTAYDVSQYQEVCFAVKGLGFQEAVRAYFYEYDRKTGEQTAAFSWVVPLSEDAEPSDSWQHFCINLYTYLRDQEMDFGDKKYLVYRIKVNNDADVDFFVDYITIGQAVSAPAKTPAARPNNILVTNVGVEEISWGYRISMKGAYCGFDFPLFGIKDAIETKAADDESITYDFGGSVSMVVAREVYATPPVSGYFDLAFNEKTTTDIPAAVTASQLKERLETDLKTGFVQVTRSGDCSSYSWEVEFTEIGGTQSEITVVKHSLGNGQTNVTLATSKEVDGRVLLAPIPGEFLRTQHSVPQVTLAASGLAAFCAGDCSFVYSEEDTPIVTSISPSSGSADESTSIDISGTFFNTDSANITVTINGVECDVTSATADLIVCDVGQSSAGKFEVKVHITGSGLATNDNATFTYNFDVTNVSPSAGSTAGGTNVTITGYGFGDDMSVMVAGRDCKVYSVAYDTLICQVQPETADSVTSTAVIVSLENGESVTLDNVFTLDSAITPTISSIDPTSTNVLGGSNLTITGTNFGSSGAIVYVGGETCEVAQQTDTEIVCGLPSHAPGVHAVTVAKEDVGFATADSVDVVLTVTYSLMVTGLFPDHGSHVGGTLVTVTGQGFGTSSDDIEVTLGDQPCEVVSVTSDLLTFVTSEITQQIAISHLGRHETFGYGYAWSEKRVDIEQGDSVQWSWAVDEYVTGISYSVHQTASESQTEYDGSGFTSGSPTTTGVFTQRFDTEGMFYYSSDAVNGLDAAEVIYMKGVVNVLPKKSFRVPFSLRIIGIEAQYNTTSGVAAPSDSTSCPGMTDPLPGCADNVTDTVDDEAVFGFSFSTCHTPIVALLTQSGTTLNITGSGLGDEACEVEVSVGDQPCEVTSASAEEVGCSVDTGGVLETGVLLGVSYRLKNLGDARFVSTTLLGRSFLLYPRIDSISTSEGSLAGGTELTLVGDGFSMQPSVVIHYAECVIVEYTYTDITCLTSGYSEGTYDISVVVNGVEGTWNTESSFTYSSNSTPVVASFSPTITSGASTVMTFIGDFDNAAGVGDISATIGGTDCVVSYVNDTTMECDVGYVPVGTQQVELHIAAVGAASFEGTTSVWSSKDLFSVSPSAGSTEGGQLVTIEGNGFVDLQPTVTIGTSPCDIQNLTISTITCITRSHAQGTVGVVVTVDIHTFVTRQYEYSPSATPQITSITPTSGESGDTIQIDGTGFGSVPSDITVAIGGVDCAVTAATDTEVECTAGAHSAGTFAVEAHVAGKGNVVSDETFMYVLGVSAASPSEGSFGGGRLLSINGSGFDEMTTSVFVCENPCSMVSATGSYITCEIPPNYGVGDELECKITVRLGSGSEVNATDTFIYKRSQTPTITSFSPKRGGTAGGTRITINGTGFLSAGNSVSIGGTVCIIASESTEQIVCVTEPHSPSEQAPVRVEIAPYGIALAPEGEGDFYYVDVWSSPYTWGGDDPPGEGTFVEIGVGQTILLDMDTPILKVLLIAGGSLIFDEKDIELKAEYIVITDDGLLQIGTHEEPFEHKAIITMYGDVRSTELPHFGAKVIAVRHGTVDMHGKPVPVMWTRLAQTVDEGSNQLELIQPVTWQVDDQIVIASTAHRHPRTESEVVTITAVSNDGMVLTFDPPVAYNHTSISQDLEGFTVETRGEVGLLTHNVVMRGNVNTDWVEQVAACEEEFDPDMFATQNCFLGKLGAETTSDQYGSQLMFFAREQDTGLVLGRLEYVEFTHAGQAFRLGRYPIHFHMNGDVNGSYVRGCSVHDTFNRAVTIHGVHNLLVEHNVAYNIMGHAYFLEDGIETNNIIQYNLAVFVRSSSSLLNVDVTPASFWVTNPNNIIRHNAAAGGTHFGFWYNMPEHPGGPSATDEVCPRNVQLGEFYNNTAHSMGWYGLWIFPSYFPKVTGECNDKESAPARYYNLTTWNTERGAEAVQAGAVQFHNFVTLGTDESGLEYQQVKDAPWGSEGALIANAVVIGWSELSEGDDERCSSSGVTAPHTSFLTVDGITFINFDRPTCAAVRACSKCRLDQGGFPTRLQGVEFRNAPNKASFQWHHEAWFEDLDGSFTGTANAKVVPDTGILPPDHCTQTVTEYSLGEHAGALCDANVEFNRMAFNNPLPDSLLYKDAIFTNDYGSSSISYHKKRLTHPMGWMVVLVRGETYDLTFQDRDHITNISYTAQFNEFGDGDFVIVSHNLTQKVDFVSVTSALRNASENPLTYEDNEMGDYFINDTTYKLSYLITGKGNAEPEDIAIDLDIYRCYYEDCLEPVPEAPPEGRPDEVFYWSDPATWENVTEGWGGSGGGVPQDGDDVQILPGLYVIANDTLPTMNKLYIYGTLELEDIRDFTLRATYILIQGGRLIAGHNETTPFTHNLHIILEGNHSTEDIVLPDNLNLGAKALGVFGTLNLHGMPRQVTWTRLAQTVNPGDSSISLEEDTDWVVGDEIAVATTDYESWHTETFTIASVTDARTFSLNSTFIYKHTAATETIDADTPSYKIAAEVGLLTRNIVIEGADYEGLFPESFGARVLVGRFYQDEKLYEGFGYFSYVQFKHTGQEGYTANYDPRFSLAFVQLGDQTVDDFAPPSYVTGCSFHHGFSPAIGIFGSDGLVMTNNVIHHCVGAGLVVESNDVELNHNLLMLIISPATYQDRDETENLLWDGGIHVEKSDTIYMRDNVVAGSERAGFRVKGEVCDEGASGWSGNVAHSALQGIMMFRESQDTCSMLANFLIYRCYHFGIHVQISSSLWVTNMTLVDNKNGMLPMPYLPNALSHTKENKMFVISDSLFVGTSDSFDCTADEVEPEVGSFTQEHKSLDTPEKGGVAAFVLTTFSSSTNLAPFFSFTSTHSYPTLLGVTQFRGVTFANYDDHCGFSGRVFISNKLSVDANHPIEVEDARFIATSKENLIFIDRPPLSKVNPSDCVDMDCDGLKKTLIRDLDGSLLGVAGTPGTIIPDSAFEWDGDPSRGLGDNRIPESMLTDYLTGERLDVTNVAPNKGIVGASSDSCVWQSSWQAYECHGYDHMMLVIESMDADTETRRVSPVALLGDQTVDLINGPQDHGWCLGYTCQERISTFYTLVATGKEYELHFTGTNPQGLRLYFVNPSDTQTIVVGIWYANPQRLDVYSDGTYINPNNVEYVNNEVTWKAPQSELEFRPTVASLINGENYYDRDRQTLYIVIHGAREVEIKTTPVVVITFGTTAVAVDDFFETNLKSNLAGLLNIPVELIRVVDIIREDGRRKRRTAAEVEVEIEIGSINSNGTSNSTNTTQTDLSFDELQEIQSVIATEFQEGSLGSALNLSISSMSMTDPVDEPVDPTGGVRATNETGGPAEGNQTYAEQQAEEEAERQAELGQPVVYVAPSALVVGTDPAEGSEHAPFLTQPHIKVVDEQGNLVTVLGHSSDPWQLTATIVESPAGITAQLLGNATLPFLDGWVNYTNLALDKQGEGYVLSFAISYPDGSSLEAVQSAEFAITPRRLTAAQSGEPAIVYATEAFEISVEVIDVVSGLVVTNLADSGYSTWTATVSLYQPSNYRGKLTSQTTVNVDLATGQATFSNLTIDIDGFGYVLQIDVAATGTDDYSFSVQLDGFDIVARGAVPHTGTAVVVMVTFDYDYSIVSGKESSFVSNFRNKIGYQYTNVTMSNFIVSEGSILLTFTMTGDTDGTVSSLYDALLAGQVVTDFEGTRLEASPTLLVNGREYTRESPDDPFPLWAIIVVSLVGFFLVVIIILIIVCKCCMKKDSKVQHSEILPLTTVPGVDNNQAFSTKPEPNPTFAIDESPTGSRTTLLTPNSLEFDKPVNKQLQLIVRDEDRSSTRSIPSTPNSPRRTPEVKVTALPPGFTEGQIEKEVEDRTTLPVNIKNPDGTFQKIGEVSANLVGTLSDLRNDIKKNAILPPKVQEKAFVFLKTEDLGDYQASEEKRFSVSEAYGAVSLVLIRWYTEEDKSDLCVCGLVGQFHCSLCGQQAYCSPQCQSSDWPRHTIPCTQWSVQHSGQQDYQNVPRGADII